MSNKGPTGQAPSVTSSSSDLVLPNVDESEIVRLVKLRNKRKRGKALKREKKIQQLPKDEFFDKVLEAVQKSTPGEEFQAFQEVLQPHRNYLRKVYLEIKRDLEQTLLRYYPKVNVYVFGSLVIDLAFHGSDLDFYINVPNCHDNDDQKLHRVFKLIRNSKAFSRSIKIAKARTPLIKTVHNRLNWNCDINLSNPLGVQNSEFLNMALHLDPRIKELVIFVKYWARVHNFGGRGRISSYTLTLLVIFYLQQVQDPLLPPIQVFQQHVPQKFINCWNMNFDVFSNYITRNRCSTADLLRGLFKFYSNIVFESIIICPYSGKYFPREALELGLPEFAVYSHTTATHNLLPILTTTPMCLQDPFEQNINCAAPVCSSELNRFMSFINHANNYCEKNPKVSSMTLLTRLLTSAPPFVLPPLGTSQDLEIGLSQQICRLQPLDSETQVIRKIIKSADEAKVFEYWADKVSQYIEKMFTEIFLVSATPRTKVGVRKGRIVLKELDLRATTDTWAERVKISFKNTTELQNEINVSKKSLKSNLQFCLDCRLTILSSEKRDFIELELSVENKTLNPQLRVLFDDVVVKHARSVIRGYLAMETKETAQK